MTFNGTDYNFTSADDGSGVYSVDIDALPPSYFGIELRKGLAVAALVAVTVDSTLAQQEWVVKNQSNTVEVTILR